MRKYLIIFFLMLSNFISVAQIVRSSWENCSKFLGNISRDLSPNNITTTPENWLTYWNQVTPSNAGKWGFVEGTRDIMNWEGLDKAYKLAEDNNLVFKQHVFVWGNQQPDWIDDLSDEEKLVEIEEWISEFCTRYPNTKQIDVVNEPRSNKPDGGQKNNGEYRADYISALGGEGTTGIDWIIKAFELARKHCPNADLILNDYGILNNQGNRNQYISIANILKNRNLIDGVGVQGHSFTIENMTPDQIKFALDQLGSSELPIYITELDIDAEGGSPEQNQLSRFQNIFPAIWEHPDVKGITLWGYIRNNIWREDAYLVSGGSMGSDERPAMVWLRNYINEVNTGCDSGGPILSVNHEFIDYNVFPNPIESGTNLNIVGDNIKSITIRDIYGRKMFSDRSQRSFKKLKINLNSGVYIIEIISENNIRKFKKFIIK